MTVEKRSASEDEYFMKMDSKKLSKLRSKLDTKRAEESKKQLKEKHWMKCPKCGSDLDEINYQDVMIDKCSECNGIWLDKGELELLTEGRARLSKTFFVSIFG